MKLGNNAIGNRERWKCVRTYHHKHTGWYSLGGRCQGGRLCRSWSLARCPWCRPSCKTSWSPPWQRSKLTSDKPNMCAISGIHIWCYSVFVLLFGQKIIFVLLFDRSSFFHRSSSPPRPSTPTLTQPWKNWVKYSLSTLLKSTILVQHLTLTISDLMSWSPDSDHQRTWLLTKASLKIFVPAIKFPGSRTLT